MFGVLTKRNSRPCENPENQPIADMLDDRAEELGRNQRMALVFRKASSSVRKYPLPIRSGKDARKLSYIGEKLALEIQRFLSTRITSTPTQRSRREISRTESAPVSSRLSFSSPAVPERPKILPGKFRLFKAPWYAMLAIHYCTKNEAPDICQESFRGYLPDTIQSAVAKIDSMFETTQLLTVLNGLKKKEYVMKKEPLQYWAATSKGYQIAEELLSASLMLHRDVQAPTSNELVYSLSQSSRVSAQSSLSQNETIIPNQAHILAQTDTMALSSETQVSTIAGSASQSSCVKRRRETIEDQNTKTSPNPPKRRNKTRDMNASTIIVLDSSDEEQESPPLHLNRDNVAVSVRQPIDFALSRSNSAPASISSSWDRSCPQNPEVAIEESVSCFQDTMRSTITPWLSGKQPKQLSPFGKKHAEASTALRDKITVSSNEDKCPEDLVGQWDVIPILDQREIRTVYDRNFMQDKLHQKGVNCEVRVLPLGDVVWIARKRGTSSGQEFVTGFILERKNIDDLAHSIRDGRYDEQKSRLKQSVLPHVIYLVEGNPSNQIHIPVSSLRTAMIKTQIVDGFTWIRSSSIDQTVEILADITKEMQAVCNKCGRYVYDTTLNYAQFVKVCDNMGAQNYQDTFTRQLRQIGKMGINRAAAIAHYFPTPLSLVKAYRELDNMLSHTSAEERNRQRQKLLENIPIGSKRIGPTISRRVASVYSPSLRNEN